ncbi:hypothetical protein V8G54_009103 [Vigna mungo]|uniref:Serine-threonine/tyrosine-protein kinase catalytic domain-containing protein n=1 Tax=Vigna mungo TaxID=3915 RepID=A0AAQ3NTC9_VIGMU
MAPTLPHNSWDCQRAFVSTPRFPVEDYSQRSQSNGYMAPEYAVDGLYSIKSDVFSFGILLLEIVCGTKNRALCHGNQTLNLVGYVSTQQTYYFSMAWTLWKEQNALQLIDSSIKDSCVVSEVLRCIHVSLLCVQQYPDDRPTMTSVIQMLGSEMELVNPKEPGFFPTRISDQGSQLNILLEFALEVLALHSQRILVSKPV